MLLFVGMEDCVSEEENEDKMEEGLPAPCPSHGRDAGNEEEKRGTLH